MAAFVNAQCVSVCVSVSVCVCVCLCVCVCVCAGVMSLHTGGVKDCSFSPDGNLLASASDDATLKVWQVETLKCITTITSDSEG